MAPITTASARSGSDTSQTAQGTLVPISAADIARVVARPESILAVYQALASGSTADAVIVSALGTNFASLADAGCLATYAAVFAGALAPNGATSLAPMTASLQQLLASPVLTGGHYCKLTMLLSMFGHPRLVPPDAATSDPPRPTMHFAVWLENSPAGVGVHTQLVVSNVLQHAYLLLDPMYSLAIRLPYAAGYPKATLTVLQNAAALLQAPTASGDYVDMWPGNSAPNRSQFVQAMTSGAMGPQYIDYGALSGSVGWDLHMATVIANMA
jgi:hypothetical protein